VKEIRLHGRGGQGVVMAGNMLATAFAFDGKYGAVIPSFGGERRGAPVSASLRFDDKPIREKTMVYQVDGLIALDPASGLLPNVFNGLRPGGVFLINRARPLTENPNENLVKTGVIDATGIALEEFGAPIPNTCIVGAFASFTGWVTLDSVIKALGEQFEGERLKKNIRAAERGFEEVSVLQWDRKGDER